MTQDIETTTNDSMKFVIYSLTFLLIFVICFLILMWHKLPLFIILMMFLTLGVVIFGIVACALILYRNKLKSKDGMIAKFVRDQTSFEEGNWFKNELWTTAAVISGLFFTIVFLMWIVGGRVIAAIIFLLLTIIVSSFLFYGAVQRNGWEFRRINNLKPYALALDLIRVFNQNKIGFREVELKKAFLNSQWSRTFSLDGGLVMVMDLGMFTMLGVKENDGNRIKTLIDVEILKKAGAVGARL